MRGYYACIVTTEKNGRNNHQKQGKLLKRNNYEAFEK